MKSEHDIECWVERQYDRVDTMYMRGSISTEEYLVKVAEIRRQAEEFYDKMYKDELAAAYEL